MWEQENWVAITVVTVFLLSIFRHMGNQYSANKDSENGYQDLEICCTILLAASNICCNFYIFFCIYSEVAMV